MEKKESVPPYRCVLEGGCGEIVEKKSRFIATVRPVETEEEAAAFIEEMKKKYWDASHNCSAFVIGRRGELTRCSDDGEPSGTAGRPMLEVLVKEGICNTAVVVTRYFGGTLLGTGGLVRAYGAAVKAGLDSSTVVTMRYGARLAVTVDYPDVGRIQHLAGQERILQESAEYGADVRFVFSVPAEREEQVCRSITEATDARARMEVLSHDYCADRG